MQGPLNSRANQTASLRTIRQGEYAIFATQGINDPDGIAPTWIIAVSLVPGQEGQKLWETTFTPPYSEFVGAGFTAGIAMGDIIPEDEVVLFEDRVILKRWAFDMKTGSQLWESEPEPQFHYYSMNEIVYDGKLLSYGRAGGVLIAYDLRTGDEVWRYVAVGEGTESPYGNSVLSGCLLADGKVYAGISEHSATTPLWRTQGLRCINATDGSEIWKIMHWGSELAVADGILVAFNWYDGQVYGYGKGPSATTVEAGLKNSVLGTKVLVEGTVTDQTPTGRRNINNEVQFTLKDTPAISDEDMEAWMEYKFMGQGRPSDAKGVDVLVSVLDPNGNYYDIDTVTSDINGKYQISFVPEVPGDYKIIATFAGTASYYPSSSVTYVTVEEPEATQPTEQANEISAPTEMYFAISTAAIIAAIAIIGALILLTLRKRP